MSQETPTHRIKRTSDNKATSYTMGTPARVTTKLCEYCGWKIMDL